MKKWYLFPALMVLLFLVNSCQKEYSLENGFGLAEGTLASELGECLPKTVGGIFEAGVALTDSNYMDVTVNVLTPGTYTISTDTLNGIYFSATGRFNAMGTTTVRLRAFGTPLAEGTDNFIVSFGASSCAVAVVTLPEGAGGPATFTFDGSPGDCQTPVVGGVYGVGTPLGTSNTIELSVNVSVIGVYNITTNMVNGISFTGTGVFSETGAASVTLVGNGTPVASGVSEFATPGTESCTFTVNVVGPAEFSIECNSAYIDGSYDVGVALDGSNYIDLGINVLGPGAYFITGSAGGMTFTDVGEFLVPGPRTVRLLASGTPTTEGENLIPISGGTFPCDVTVSVNPAAAGSGSWAFTQGSLSFNGVLADLTLDGASAPPATILEFNGDNGDGDYFFFTILDIAGGIQANETYTTTANQTASNTAFFRFESGIDATTYEAGPISAPPIPLLTITVTSHNTTTRTIQGTFSGKARDENDVVRDLTGGTFVGTY
ncbi:MAG: hypothetical protein EOO09_09695 [Chitinophagaceae bacterium]|nr:MAG: hypothetical protein EOO09_09695 [Chitinophagaceae bacterium]